MLSWELGVLVLCGADSHAREDALLGDDAQAHLSVLTLEQLEKISFENRSKLNINFFAEILSQNNWMIHRKLKKIGFENWSSRKRTCGENIFTKILTRYCNSDSVDQLVEHMELG